MSDQESIKSVPALRAALAAQAGVIAVGNSPAAEDDALYPPDNAPPEVFRLRALQRAALENLMSGKTYTETARILDINRRTLFRWVNHDPAFRGAMEAWRERTMRSVEDFLTEGAEAAARTLTRAAHHDPKAAFLLLKGRGLLGARPSPARSPAGRSTTGESITIDTSQKEIQVLLRELILSFRDKPADVPIAPALESPPTLVNDSAADGPEPSAP